VWAFHVDWANPLGGSTFHQIAYLPVTPFDSRVDGITQPGQPLSPSPLLDAVADVVATPSMIVPQLMYHLDYAYDAVSGEHLVATQTVDVGFDHAAVRWYELGNTGAPGALWTVQQQGDYAPDADNRFMSSGGIDNSGELALAYSVSSATMFPSLSYTGRLPGDGAGVMSIAETSLFAGSDAQTSNNRWGDYSSLSLDPLDLCTFWYTGEYAGPTDWRTRIGEFNFSTCVPQSPTRPVLTADQTWSTPIVREGQTITGTAATFGGAVSVVNQWRRCDRYGFSCVDIPGETALTHVFAAADAAGDRTVRFQETATNLTGASISASTATPLIQSLPPANLTLPVISGSAQDGQTLATSNGTWTSSSAPAYTYRWRNCTTSCVFIAGATLSSYTLTPAEVGATVDVVVSATNTGGGTDANAGPTGTVVAAPVVSGGGGTGGGTTGGTGAGAPDLQVTGFASAATPAVGDLVSFALTVTDANLILAQSVVLTVTLPSGLQFVSGSADRGSGCSVTTATKVSCNLDFLSTTAPRANVQILARVITTGQQILTATVTAQQGLLNTTKGTVSVSVVVPVAKTTAGGTTTGPPTGLNGSPKATPDKKKPTSHAIASKGTRGQTVKLRFRTYDDRGVAKAVATVKRNGKVYRTAKTGFGPVAYGSTYFVGWHIAANAPKGRYTFCVVATDRAGNHSPSSCAALILK
jgi:uncharacterized repeat protein (TIGR01451 family)